MLYLEFSKKKDADQLCSFSGPLFSHMQKNRFSAHQPHLEKTLLFNEIIKGTNQLCIN